MGVTVLAAATAEAISSTPIPRAASASGSSWMRTAYFWLPNTCTWATPSIVERAGAMTCWLKASMSGSGVMSPLNARIMIGASAGFTLR